MTLATTPYDVAEHLRTPKEQALYLQACMDEAGDDAGPSGLVTGAEAGAVVAVEVFVEPDVVSEIGIILEFFNSAKNGPAAVVIAEKDAGHAGTEFLRNLMVCKDERTAGLLDTVESFRERYKSAAKDIALPYLISAVNILTEAEIGYKQARNKKLHVELALIKLTYLEQALDLTADDFLVRADSSDQSLDLVVVARNLADRDLEIGRAHV